MLRQKHIEGLAVDDSFGTYRDSFIALRKGTVAGVATSVATAICEAASDTAIEIGMPIGPPASIGFAVRKENPQLLADLDAYVKGVRHSSTWSQLAIQYFGSRTLNILKMSRGEEGT